AMQINEPPSLTSNSPQKPIQIDGPPSLTLAISTAIYNNQDYTNNFTDIYNQQYYSNDFTTVIYNQQDYTTAIDNQQDYANYLTQNSIDNVYIIDSNNDNNGSINTSSTLEPFIINTPLIPSPLTQSQSLQLFMTKYDSCHF
ncbi:4614_t:CDS:2, partial [Ambispora gerdemannii]